MKLVSEGKIWSDRTMAWSETALVPMTHEWLIDHYRVPIYKQFLPEDSYTVYIGKNATRMYTMETMPDYIKTKITIANAHREPIFLDDDVMTPLNVFAIDGYISKDMQETAWRVCSSIYVVVLNKVEFENLRSSA